MSSFIQEIDARTQLAGANRFEILLFSMGVPEIYGINVFKVREVFTLPELTRLPETDPRIEGLLSVRGTTLPVIDLRQVLGLPDVPREDGKADHLIVTEYNRNVQAFHVRHVDRIVRVSWSQVIPPPLLAQNKVKPGTITAVAKIDQNTTVLLVDVEKILSDLMPEHEETLVQQVQAPASPLVPKRVLFADDSAVARTQIRKTLARLGITGIETNTGQEAWDALLRLAEEAESQNKGIRDLIHLVLSDVEMPAMDGFTLTKQIRADARFHDLPIVLHSSLTGMCNREHGRVVGATDYVGKFDPKELSSIVLKYCSLSHAAAVS
jgi:two-component system, chemotaxis family, chemotaxis protein CheV